MNRSVNELCLKTHLADRACDVIKDSGKDDNQDLESDRVDHLSRRITNSERQTMRIYELPVGGQYLGERIRQELEMLKSGS